MKKLYNFGVMQGRLLPKYQGRYQAHPVGYWQQEFLIAQNLGLDYIEFILDYNDLKKNPLMSEEGLKEITLLAKETKVFVGSVCADYFMAAPLHSSPQTVITKRIDVLDQLIENCSKIGVTDIVIPLVDNSSMKTTASQNEFIINIQSSIKKAEKYNINLSLETDLNPEQFKDLLEQLPSSKVTVNYDSGNSAALGYNLHEEFAAYGNRISSIHIKDRILGGGSVVLGAGNANFDDLCDMITLSHYNTPLIMQAYRDDEGITIFKQQLDWFRKKLDLKLLKREVSSCDNSTHTS